MTSGRIIQGFFPGGARLAPSIPPSVGTASDYPVSGHVRATSLQHQATVAAHPVPAHPPLAHASATQPVQRRATPGRPPLVGSAARPVQRRAVPGAPPLVGGAVAPSAGAGRPVQQFGGDGSFAVDPARVGLVRNGGMPLPGALLAKMEAAFGADFSGVRVHVGPQASRIGALAFTTGCDLYFAPGQYQPDTVKGQQLIGHELAHVIQQRQGRVRTQGGGVTVVQDRALEAEADRLGMKAASLAQGRDGTRTAPAGSASGDRHAAESHRTTPVQAYGLTLQAQKYNTSRPEGTKGSVHRYSLGGVRYLEDERFRRWRWDDRGHWVKAKKKAVKLHNRFKVTPSGRGAPRAASFASRMGSGASYGGSRTTGNQLTSPLAEVVRPSAGKRIYRGNMLAATTAEGLCPTNSATVYAAHFNAPVVGGGYNWCHLIGHGGGGSDDANNIVAASTHANSEQLEIERVIYHFKCKGLQTQVVADLQPGSNHLARWLTISVHLNGTVIFSRKMDAWRATKPDMIELASVETHLSMAIYKEAQ